MLRGIDPILPPELLHILRAMGHGDELAIVDANFPAVSCAQRLVRIDAANAVDTARAVLSLMPLDSYADNAAFSMQVVGAPETIPEIVTDFQEVIRRTADNPSVILPIERFAFYEQAKKAYAIVCTGERRLYGNLIIKKGVLNPD